MNYVIKKQDKQGNVEEHARTQSYENAHEIALDCKDFSHRVALITLNENGNQLFANEMSSRSELGLK